MTVTPTAPVMVASDVCGVTSEVRIPEAPGVVYSQSVTGFVVTVGAQAAPGYVFPQDATTTWTFDTTPEECACVPAAVPWDGGAITGYAVSSVSGEITVTFGPNGWLDSLAPFAPTFAVELVRTDSRSYSLVATGPAGMPDQLVATNGLISASNVDRYSAESGSVVSPDTVSFAPDRSSTNDDLWAKLDERYVELVARYPDAGLVEVGRGNSDSNTLDVTVTVINSCGAAESRTLTQRSGGGGGGI
jgi:hypothetical protein